MVDKNIFSKSHVSVKAFAILKGNKKLVTPKSSAHSKTCRVQREGSLCSWLRVILLVDCWVHALKQGLSVIHVTIGHIEP